MRTFRQRLLTTVCVLYSIGLPALYFWGVFYYDPRTPERPSPFDVKLEREIRPSTDFAADRGLMWHAVPGTSDFFVSTVSAINAASRVFATVSLEGVTTNEMFELVGHPYQSCHTNYGYCAPFIPTDAAVVYRFDCGNFGWQFDIHLDAESRVERVQRRWIH